MASEEHASVEETFSLVSHPRRRLVVQYFKQNPNPIVVSDLADRVARWEQDQARKPPSCDVETVQRTLVESHLPKMEECLWLTSTDECTEVVYDGHAIAVSLRNASDVIGFLWHPDQPDGA